MLSYIRKLSIALLMAAASLPGFGTDRLDMIVPLPRRIARSEGNVELSSCKLKFQGVSQDVRTAASDFCAQLSRISEAKRASATLVLKQEPALADEEYQLLIAKDGTVTLSASGYNGFLYGLQTLRQLLPPQIYGSEPAPKEDWTVPCCTIKDKPYFSYRGAHLDVVRHFFSVDEVKKYLDAMALCKMNRFHWHLSDDQGWRVQVDRYPLLTKVGGWRKGTQIGYDTKSCDGVRYGGYYTKEQIREVVAYAKKLGIEVIPEIDLPGHMLAALSAYPEYGCRGDHYEAWTRWGVSKEVLCPGKEKTFEFLEGILDEVSDLFPFEIFHIGGDECPKESWRNCPHCQARIRELGFRDDENGTKEDYLQTYVMARIQKFLAGKGKKIIGWDEILKGDPAKGSIIMQWRRGRDLTEASKRGFNSILVPCSHFYLDYCQLLDFKNCPPSIARGFVTNFVTFSKLYGFNPHDGLSSTEAQHIMGVQCNLWTEYIATPEHLEYMAMPRFFAVSEIQWQDPSGPKDLSRVKAAVNNHEYKVLDAMGFTYCGRMD